MSQLEKAKSLLEKLGYIEKTKGKTSGSRVMFINQNKDIILLHKPHPQNVMKRYSVSQLREHLIGNGELHE